MNSDAFSGGLALAIAAGLWFIYLLPTWLKRREYLASERNALRLQQTLRIMAETTEVPQQFSTEISARGVAEQQRRLRRQIQKEDAMAKARDAAEERQMKAQIALSKKVAEAEQAALAERDVMRLAPAARGNAVQSERLRRSKLISTLVSAIALIVGFVALFLSAWVLAILGVVVLGAGVVLLRNINRTEARLSAPAIVTRAHGDRPLIDHQTLVQAHQTVSKGWVPTEVPKPLYLSRPVVDSAALASMRADASRDAARKAAELQEASRRSEQALREAQSTVPAIVPVPESVEEAPATPSRFAGMGYVDAATQNDMPSIDEVLRRRRAG